MRAKVLVDQPGIFAGEVTSVIRFSDMSEDEKIESLEISSYEWDDDDLFIRNEWGDWTYVYDEEIEILEESENG